MLTLHHFLVDGINTNNFKLDWTTSYCFFDFGSGGNVVDFC